MAKIKRNWASVCLDSSDKVAKIHNPKIWSKVFRQKEPFAFCANEDCVYKKSSACPAGDLKANCPNCSALDFTGGCNHYVGKPFQAGVLSDSISGQYQIITVITGRGTGKSSVIDTQKVLMEATTEPYVRAYLSKSQRPIPAKILVIGNTKATSLLLRHSVHNAFLSSDSLYSFVNDDTKTYISTNNGLCEIFFLTAGVDGRGIRGHHADIIKNVEKMNVRCTIIMILDEGMFTRATDVVSSVMIPSLQVGNTFSQIIVTSTPYGNKGEVTEMRKNPIEAQRDYQFASYHNKYTNLRLLHDLRRKMVKAGQGAIYNREVLGIEQADDALYWPMKVWIKSIDGSIDWFLIDDIEDLKKTASTPLPGTYYCGVDPNKFRQIDGGDFAAYHLVQVANDRSKVRAISYGKFLLDTEDKFFEKLELINEVFHPTFCVDENSGYGGKLRRMGDFDVRNCSNRRHVMNPAMRICKQDVIDDIYKQPYSQSWEDERQCFVPKEDGVSNIPILDHKGNWGQGFSSDLMRCLGYIYEQLMIDFNIDGSGYTAVSSIEKSPTGIQSVSGNKLFDSIVRSATSKFSRLKR